MVPPAYGPPRSGGNACRRSLQPTRPCRTRATPHRPGRRRRLGYGDVGVYNSESCIPTPNMDRLASEGIGFNNMHSTDSVCTPSRYGLLTGRYCGYTRLERTVLFSNDPRLVEPGRLKLASVSKRKGSRTGMFGKWCLRSTLPSRTVSTSTSTGSSLGTPDRVRKWARASISRCPPRADRPRLRRGPSYTAGYSTDQEPLLRVPERRDSGNGECLLPASGRELAIRDESRELGKLGCGRAVEARGNHLNCPDARAECRDAVLRLPGVVGTALAAPGSGVRNRRD